MKHQIPGTLAAITLATLTGAASAQNQATPADPAGTEVELAIKKPDTEKEAFIGVHMSRPTPIVTTQLGLEDGIGIVVEAVQEDSPAGQAGIQRYDILTKLDDQFLIQPEQFATLVRRYSPGDTVKLTLLRHAKEKTVKVVLGSRDKPQDMQAFGAASGFGDTAGGTSIPGSIFGFGSPGTQPGGASGGDEIDLSRSFEAIKKALGNNYSEEIARQVERTLRQSLDIFDDLQITDDDDAKVEIEEETDGEGNTVSKATSVTSSSTSTVVQTEDGTRINLIGKNGNQKIIVADEDNTTIYEGPYNTEADKKKIPAEIRKKLKVLDSVKVNVRRR